MAQQPWKTDDYFVSPWNYASETTAGFSPPARVEVHDVTLRDGEQQASLEKKGLLAEDQFRAIAERVFRLPVGV